MKKIALKSPKGALIIVSTEERLEACLADGYKMAEVKGPAETPAPLPKPKQTPKRTRKKKEVKSDADNVDGSLSEP